MHSITIVGRLGRDPELRYTPDGTPVASFTVADNGDRRAGVVWFRVTTWRRLAETCAEYLSKGRSVAVVGTLQADDTGAPRVWTGNDGQARASFEVTASSVEFLSGGQQERAGHSGQHPQQGRGYGPGGGEPPDEGPYQEEIPF